MASPKYLPRSWWADSGWSRGGAALVGTDLHRLGNVNHYPGRASSFGVLSLESLRRNLRGWWAYHVKTRGWSDIGYQACMSLTVDGPVVVDLRGIGRVPAAHASASNPRANWHGGATLWTIGNTETIDHDLIEAYRHFRHDVWLKRWPTATGVTHHRRVPGAQTSCAGHNMEQLVRSGTLRHNPREEEMSTTGPEKWDGADKKAVREILFGENHFLNNVIVKHSENLPGANGKPKNLAWVLRLLFYNVDRVLAEQAVHSALVEQVVGNDPGNPLSEERIKQIIEDAINNNVLKVDISVLGADAEDGEVE